MHFWILTTPRSGSNFVAGELWRRLGGTPKHMEYFNPGYVRHHPDFVPCSDAPVASYLRYLEEREACRGILCLKMLYFQLQVCCRYPDFLHCLRKGPVILLRRRDVISQGISRYISTRTGSWVSSDAPTHVSVEQVSYDYAAIAANVARMEQHNALLERFLRVEALDCLPVWYEDVVAATDRECDRVLRHLNLPRAPGPLIADEVFALQATDINREFRERFVEDERRRIGGDGSYRGPPLFPEDGPRDSTVGECDIP